MTDALLLHDQDNSNIRFERLKDSTLLIVLTDNQNDLFGVVRLTEEQQSQLIDWLTKGKNNESRD